MKKYISFTILVVLLLPALVQAANSCSGTSTNNVTALPTCINQIYVWSLGVAALLALMMMVIGSYYYMTAAGNAERSAKGVEIIWSSIIGIAILFGAYLLLNTINPQLVNFQLTKGICYDKNGKATSATQQSQCTGDSKWYTVFDNGTTAAPGPTSPAAPRAP